jgi:hypothetical protein
MIIRVEFLKYIIQKPELILKIFIPSLKKYEEAENTNKRQNRYMSEYFEYVIELITKLTGSQRVAILDVGCGIKHGNAFSV